MLKKIRPVKLKSKNKIQRAVSVPNLGHANDNDQSYLSNFGIYEEEAYPQTPDLDTLRQRDSFKSNHSNRSPSPLITNM